MDSKKTSVRPSSNETSYTQDRNVEGPLRLKRKSGLKSLYILDIRLEAKG